MQLNTQGFHGSRSTVLMIVDVTEDKLEEFLPVVEDYVKKSRDNHVEPGCLRFDVLREPNTNKFMIYKVFVDDGARDFHKKQEHYKTWREFYKQEGNSKVERYDALETASIGTW